MRRGHENSNLYKQEHFIEYWVLLNTEKIHNFYDL
jgi:hypothetical protein